MTYFLHDFVLSDANKLTFSSLKQQINDVFVLNRCFCLILAPPCVSISLLQTVRHGFPYQPTSMAFDPVQKILAIGSRTGGIRMYPSNSLPSSLSFLSLSSALPPPFHRRHCGPATTQMLLHQNPTSAAVFPPQPHRHPAPFHPSCVIIISTSHVVMLQIHNHPEPNPPFTHASIKPSAIVFFAVLFRFTWSRQRRDTRGKDMHVQAR